MITEKEIALEARKHIFAENYSFGKNGNTRLCLYFVKSTILKWGGSIYVEDNLPKGTTFVINSKKA